MRDLAKCSFPRWAPVCPGKRATSQPSRFGTLNLLTPKRMGTSLRPEMRKSDYTRVKSAYFESYYPYKRRPPQLLAALVPVAPPLSTTTIRSSVHSNPLIRSDSAESHNPFTYLSRPSNDSRARNKLWSALVCNPCASCVSLETFKTQYSVSPNHRPRLRRETNATPGPLCLRPRLRS